MRVLLLVILAGVMAGCSGNEENTALTERERNEAIASSPLPGAAVVGRSLAVTDSASARAERLQQLTAEDP